MTVNIFSCAYLHVFFGKYLFRSEHFLIRLFSMLLSSVSSLYILDINPLSDMCFAIIFYSVGCIFILLMISFAVWKLFSLSSSTCLFLLLFVSLAFGIISKKLYLDWCQGSYYLCFLLGILYFQIIINSLIHFELIFVYDVIV